MYLCWMNLWPSINILHVHVLKYCIYECYHWNWTYQKYYIKQIMKSALTALPRVWPKKNNIDRATRDVVLILIRSRCAACGIKLILKRRSRHARIEQISKKKSPQISKISVISKNLEFSIFDFDFGFQFWILPSNSHI